MAERLAVTQGVQLGVESTPGTSVAANRLLPSLQLVTGFGAGFTEVRGSGYKFPTAQVPGKEWTEAKIAAPGGVGYDEIPYLFASLLQYTAPTGPTGTTAYTWVSAPSSTAADTIKTFTVEQGDAVRAQKFTYGLVSELTLKGDREKVELSGAMIGQRMSDGITMTGTPTILPQIPILPRDVSIYLDTTAAGIGGTKLTRVLSWEWSVKNRYSPLWVVDSANTSFVAHTETAVQSELKLKVEADSTHMPLWTTYGRGGTPAFFRIAAVSTLNAGSAIPYSCKIDLCGAASAAPSDFTDEDGTYAIEVTFKVTHDPTWAKAMTISTINKTTTI